MLATTQPLFASASLQLFTSGWPVRYAMVPKYSGTQRKWMVLRGAGSLFAAMSDCSVRTISSIAAAPLALSFALHFG